MISIRVPSAKARAEVCTVLVKFNINFSVTNDATVEFNETVEHQSTSMYQSPIHHDTGNESCNGKTTLPHDTAFNDLFPEFNSLEKDGPEGFQDYGANLINHESSNDQKEEICDLNNQKHGQSDDVSLSVKIDDSSSGMYRIEKDDDEYIPQIDVVHESSNLVVKDGKSTKIVEVTNQILTEVKDTNRNRSEKLNISHRNIEKQDKQLKHQQAKKIRRQSSRNSSNSLNSGQPSNDSDGNQKSIEKKIKYRKDNNNDSAGVKKYKQPTYEERRIECDICFKVFWTRSSLEIHKRTHTGEKDFKCDICKKSFISDFKLKIHAMTHTGENSVKCDFCDQLFTSTYYYRRHVLLHTEEKQFECDVCHKKFHRLNSLNDHKRVHSGEKPFQCEFCHKHISDRSGLNRHKKLMHRK